MSGKTVCVLGGGIGGVVAAARLSGYVGKLADVVLIDENPNHVFAPGFLGVLTGQRQPEELSRPLKNLEKRGVRFINAAVTAIDTDAKNVRAGSESIDYDYLVIALGAESDMGAIDGLDAAINLYSLEGVLDLRAEVLRFDSGQVSLLVPRNPYKCPAAPYEAILIIEAELARRGVRDKAEIAVYSVEPFPMPGAGPGVGRKVVELLESRGIKFFAEQEINSVGADKVVSFAGGQTIAPDLLVTIPPHKAPTVIKESGLAGESGWIPVDAKTMKTKADNVFAIGDVNVIKLPGKYKPDKPLMLPKAGVFANREAEVVAANIAAEIRGEKPESEFSGHGECFLDLGTGKAAYAAGNFYAKPHPKIDMSDPRRLWRYYKTFIEKFWFFRWF